MMSAQRDSRRRLPALTYPAISTETAAPCRLLDGQRAPFSSCWIACPDSGLACLPSKENNALALHRSSVPSKARSRPAGSLCGPCDF
jgi:hypothetical protein